MTEENKGVGPPDSAEALSEGILGVVKESPIPDYVMLDFADDYFLYEAADSRSRKYQTPPDVFG